MANSDVPAAPRVGPLLPVPRLLATTDADFADAFDRLRYWDLSEDGAVYRATRAILDAVRSEGDAAVLRYTAEFDGVSANNLTELRIEPDELVRVLAGLDSNERAALQTAADRVRRYHEHQRQPSWEFTDELGNRLGQRVTALKRVGLYVPGGQAAYPSTVLMTAIPAQVAGVSEIVMTVPTPGGVRNPLVLAAAAMAGVNTVFCIGGAQAIGALAFGTQTIAKVDKIVGPGGAFVAAAKRQVYGQVGIDMIAGPSEVVVIADGTTPADWVAMDLFSQAEHDAAAQAILLTPDAAFRTAVLAAMQRLLPSLPRRELIADSLANRGALILTRDMNEAVALANRIAPEHLELAVSEPNRYVEQIHHAGAIFLGARAGEVFGDYIAGPSHVLPTFGTARFSSPLGVYDFQKRSSVINISAAGIAALGPMAATLARGEGLQAHAEAAALRVDAEHNRLEPE